MPAWSSSRAGSHGLVIYVKDSNHSYFYSNNLKFNSNVTYNLDMTTNPFKLL